MISVPPLVGTGTKRAGWVTRRIARFLREDVRLRDGRTVLLRPIRASDAPRLVDLHRRLSEQSRYLRLHGAHPEISVATARYFAGVDFERRFAIVAVVRSGRQDSIVAVGRFDIGDEGTAELALVVRDDYQAGGLGTAILTRLLDMARGRGVRAMTASVLSENRAMLKLLGAKGFDAVASEHGVTELRRRIDDPPSVLTLVGTIARRQLHG
jgi:L-amino acid N-acyltransferase YncA